MATKAIPEGFSTATPYLVVKGAADAIDFYERAFNAKELFRMPDPKGRVMHAELRIGNSNFMLADEFPERGHRGPRSIGGSPVSFMLYVENVDEVFERALNAGATSRAAVQNQFYGDRMGMLEDPFGHVWMVATHVEDVPPAELERRAKAMFQS